ncbi:ankycorbin isoform X1 [Cataglyphis hispanica]|uniref:ankycorbin isoform X1 n=1 Tax=Cataglyphis hispanica TaxID=1086592 RepID=UPI0021805E21|nr:ankycorbin isoform X1 [Cataglyphis hispanica]XP_050446941.1 ankycorbin isoform X1 [Cataglyphis hispanica]XP_050446942.1 ankycorbin isoform X1 [Cataglyphis hispanica]XP_050446943.1 ankycorbin isoform X1 [Cataglyphis hispanica]
MDTKTPPIPLKPQEKSQPQKKTERVADVSLPPLTSCPNHRTKDRSVTGTSQDPRPCVASHQDHRKKRPYRVLHIGATPLMHACQQGDRARVLRLLKEQGETIAYRDRTLRNALHYCMDAGTGGAVAAAAPELVNAPDAEGHTPLHLAVIAGDTQLVAVLLANGADVNAKDLEGHSVLHWATVCGEAECVRLVLAAGARPSTPDLRGGSPLHYAAQCCGAAATTELAVPKKIGLKVLQTLLEFGADVNAKDEDGRQPILWAASAGSVEAVLALARAGGSAAAGTSDKDGLTALHCAASRGHARCVETLVNLCGSHPDHVDDNGCSALHYAATLGHADATALILKLGADPNRQDRKGRTPALCAAAKGQLETLKILSQHGGSLHARTVRGTGIGHEAVASGRIELIKWLAKKRPSTLDVATPDGKTPLHVAALHGYLDACKILLDHGARINAVLRTSKGNSMTPLDAALYRGHRDCAKLIQMHGGSTAQQLRTHKTAPNKVFTAKFRMKHDGSSSASDSSPCRKDRRRHRHPELYYEERWIERRTRRKSNLKKLARRDSRSFSEEEVRLSKTSTKKDERRARSESARYDNGNSGRNLRRKRSRRISMSHKHEYSDSSIESDSCDYSHDNDETEATVQRQRAKVQQKTRKNKSKSSNETTAKDSSKKEDNDDDRSVSDDSLEVIVVKKSLEKKCEKMVSGRKSKTPRECTKETKLTKMHKRSSKKTSRPGRSKKSDIDENIVARNESSDKKEKCAAIREPVRTSGTTFEKDEVDERIIESRYRRDATDSTSQETVEQVIVTAMVHKDQMPDTPKLTLDTAREISYQDVLKKETIETETTKEISRDITTSDKNETASSYKMDRQDVSGESVPKVTQENSEITEEIQDEDEKAKKTNDKIQDRLDTSENVTPSTEHEKQKTDEDKISDELSYLSIELNAIEESVNKKSNSSKDEEKSDKQSVSDQKDLSQHSITMDEENGKSISDNSKQEENTKTVPKQTLSDNEESKTRHSEICEAASSLKDKIADLTGKEEGETLTKQISVKTVAKENSESIKDAQSKEDKELKKHDEKSMGVSSMESMLNVEETLSPGRTLHDKDLENVNGSDNGERSKIETNQGGKDSHSIDDSCSSSPKSLKLVKTKRSRPSTGRNARTGRSSSNTLTKKHLFGSSEECSPHQRAIVAVIDSPEWDEDEAVEQEIRQALGEDTLERDTEHEEDNEIGVMRVLPSTSEEETLSMTLGTSRTARIDSLPQIQSTTSNRLVRIENSDHGHRERFWRKQRRDSGGRDSGIEPSPRVSRIPRRRNAKCCPNTEKQQTLNMETITRDVQISLRRYYLERKIFFQLMELKRLQIRHGRANEHVLVKRQVEAFNRSGMSGPTLGVAKYDQPLTFRQFEAFLYEQLRRLQGRPTTPDFCTEAKQCTQKTHRCHHATSAYTSIPVYTYLGGDGPDRTEHLPKIESRGRGHMTVEVTHGEEKQVIALPTEKLDRTKKYFVTFTVRGETQDDEKSKSSCTIRRNAKSV